jgi:hypothetical protein
MAKKDEAANAEKMPSGYVVEDKAALKRLIDANEKNAFKYINTMHKIGVSALWHLAKHGDIMQVNAAYLSMPKGMKSAGFAQWLLAHGALAANTDEDRKTKPFIFDKKKKTNVEAAYADGWWEHMPEKKPTQIFDLQEAIRSLIARAEKQKTMSHAELLPTLKSLAAIGAVHGAEQKAAAGEKLTDAEKPLLEAGSNPEAAVSLAAQHAIPAKTASAPAKVLQ